MTTRAWMILVLVTALVLAVPRGAQAQARRVPLRLDVSSAERETTAGRAVAVTVTLQNVDDDPVAALTDTVVTVSTGSMTDDVLVSIPKGASSASVIVAFPTTGIARLTASGDGLAPGHTVIPVGPEDPAPLQLPAVVSMPGALDRVRATAPPIREVGGGRGGLARGEQESLDMASIAPPSARGGLGVLAAPVASVLAGDGPFVPGAPVTIGLEVMPDEVHPRSRQWSASILAILTTRDRSALAVADRDVLLEFSARFGTVSPAQAVIRAGSTSADLVRLVADRPGENLVRALSTVAIVERTILFVDARPSALRLHASPSPVVNDGHSIVHLTVFLEGPDGQVVASPERDVPIALAAEGGTLEHHELTVSLGQQFAQTTLTSRRPGPIRVTAESAGLAGGAAVVTFLFPWLMVLLGALGGVLGSLARLGDAQTRTQARWRHLAMGVVFGLLFCFLAFSGAVSSVGKIDLAALVSWNEIGALVLGFVGGLGGVGLWDWARGNAQ